MLSWTMRDAASATYAGRCVRLPCDVIDAEIVGGVPADRRDGAGPAQLEIQRARTQNEVPALKGSVEALTRQREVRPPDAADRGWRWIV